MDSFKLADFSLFEPAKYNNDLHETQQILHILFIVKRKLIPFFKILKTSMAQTLVLYIFNKFFAESFPCTLLTLQYTMNIMLSLSMLFLKRTDRAKQKDE